MTRVFLGLGSNIEPHTYIPQALARLGEDYRLCQVSPAYASPAHGFDGDDFINLVVEIDCGELTVLELAAQLKQMEYDFGRPQQAKKYSSRTLDIDILLFGQMFGDISTALSLPRDDVYRYAFVLKPLIDIAPDILCPATKQPLADGLAQLADQPLTQVELQPLTPDQQMQSAAG